MLFLSRKNAGFHQRCYRESVTMTSLQLPRHVTEVPTPSFLVDVDIVRRNAKNMIDRCSSLGLKLRPHMKTHKCLKIGEITTAGSSRCIAVSTLREAEVFADSGYDDILFAAHFGPDKISRLKRLASRLMEFHLLIDSEAELKLLEQNPVTDKLWSVFIEVDCGYGRAGIVWFSEDGVDLAQSVSTSKVMTFAGLYCHEGQSYAAKDAAEIRDVGDEVAERIFNLANRIREAGAKCPSVGLGSTPTASQPSPLMRDITELHPGNYVFYDVQQLTAGSCGLNDIAVKVATRVIGHYPHRNQLVVDAGWMAMSLDGQGKLPTGSFCLFQDHPDLRLVKMTQEIGIVDSQRGKINYEEFPVGKLLFLFPYHSCATACMHAEYLVCSGNDVVDVWKPFRGW